MVNTCCVKYCRSEAYAGCGISFFGFPRNENIRRKWFEVVPFKTVYTKNSLVCSHHFRPEDLTLKIFKGSLKLNAVPSIFPFMVSDNSNRDANSLKSNHMDHTYSKLETGGLQRHTMSASNKDNLEPDDEADNISGTDDDPLSESHADESNEEPIVPEKAYSWEKKKDAVPIQADIVEDDEDNLSMYCDDGASPPHYKELQDDPTLHQGYHCNVCNGEIRGFRYTCVQCNDFDLCSACETNKAHHHHYVLRVPEPRPYVEIQSILGRIRRHLMQKMDPIGDPDQDVDDVVSIKSEVKSEDEDEEPMKETTKEVADNEIQPEAAQLENVANEIELDTVEIDNSVTSKHSVVHIKEIPTPSEPKAVSREKQWTPTPGQRKLLVKLEDFMNMPNAKRICLMRVPSTQSEKRQDGCHTSQNKPQSTDSKLHPPEPPDPLNITQNASTKLSLSVYKRRFPLDDR